MRNGLRRYINPRNRDPIPAMSLLFARDKALDPRVTFTRASSGTYFDASGVMQTASTDVPRFTHDPVTGQSLGLLIEESRTNLLTYSEEFDNAAWTKAECTISANAITAPGGSLTADKVVESSATGAHLVQQIKALSSAAHTFSIFAKKGGRNWVYLRGVGAGGINIRAWFNLDAGTVGTVNTGGTGSITSIGGGWYFCVLTIASAVASGFEYQYGIADDDNSVSYAGDGTSGIYIWGAQLEAGSTASSYIKTTSSTATRAADNASITGSNFSDWYNQAEGAFVVDYENGLAGYIVLAAGSDTSNVIRLGTRLTGSSDEILVVIDGGVIQVSLSNSPSTGRNLCAFSYRENDFALSMNGAAASTTSFGTVPTADTLAIGGTPFYGAFNGTIASIAYYPTRLSNSHLQYLSS